VLASFRVKVIAELGLVSLCSISALFAAIPSSARAQSGGERAASYLVSSVDEPRAQALDPLVRAWLAAHGEPDAELLAVPRATREATVSRSELDILTHVEAILREARELSARFDERVALQRYHEADQLLRAALEIPHVHAWLAEVNLQFGLCAAQIGALGLAETALTRAASLDPQRTLQAAEAPPNMVALARSIERRRASAPLSQVLIEVEPSGASLWLDGRHLGQSPQELGVASGVHVLRVAAPGYRPYATLLELGPGRRAPIRVRLSETPQEAARRALAMANDPEQARARAHSFASLAGQTLWLFEGGNGPLIRALAYRCDPECTLAGTLGQPPELSNSAQQKPAMARAWLLAEPLPEITPQTTSSERPWWKRWPVWTAGAVAVVGAGLAAGLLATREPKVVNERMLVLDPGELPP
jgi:hypothetical protein